MFAFLSLLFVLMVVYLFTTTNAVTNAVKEGFNPIQTPPSHKVNIPINRIPVQLPPANVIQSPDVKPSTVPGPLPIAPYEQTAAMSPLPYQDTTLIKANRQQLINLLERLKGFLAFEAQIIAERSDPTIQLPLNTARSDFHSLQNEVQVLNRNPGLQPTFTLSHVNDIDSNLAFLQQQVRLTGSAGPIQGPIYEFTQPIEGFQDAAMAGQIATPEDLASFIARIQGEILRLSASGTTDPIVDARVQALTKMKGDVQQIADQVKSGAIMTSEIPIMKDDLEKAFPILGKPSEPLPQIIKTLKLPAGLANALPSNLQNDPNTTRQIDQLMDKYASEIVQGVSAGVSFHVNYTSPREANKGKHSSSKEERAHARASTVDQTGFPSMSDLDNISGNKFIPMDSGAPLTDSLAPKPMDAGRGPSHFDWKTRAKEIESQVKKRGLNPKDFGIMPAKKVSDEFSWKGYARMICTRLQATMDPGLPETCGCPPMDWSGWRIAK
jgi:hypothetical protein